MAGGDTRAIYDVALRGELAHISGPALAGSPAEWLTYSWDADGAFGVAHSASNYSGDEEDLADLQTIDGSQLIDGELPLQDLVRYVDADDSLALPNEFTFDPNDPLTPTFGIKPIVFDLDGDGLDLINPGASPILRDGNNDGAEDRMGWVGEGDGILALDRNNDGVIDPVTEISFVDDLPGATTDLEGLRAYDSNQDGWLDASDHDFGRFQIWQDVSYNAISEEGEVVGLAEAGIARIHLQYEADTSRDGGVLSNRVFGEALFQWSNGSFGTLGDVELLAFEGNALEQAIQRDRRNSLISPGQLQAAAERARRRQAISELSAGPSGGGEENRLGSEFALPETPMGSERMSRFSPASEKRPMPDGIERADLMAGLNLQNTISTGRNYRGPFDWVAEVGPFEPTEMSNGAGEWWLDSRRRQVRQGYGPHVRTLSERLHAFDLARQTGDLTESSQISIPEDQAGRLAERQKFLQAMASFRGSSGMYVPKRFGEPDKSGNEEFGAGSSWLHAGRRGAALR